MCNKMKSPKNTKSPDTVGCRGDGIGWVELQRLVGALVYDGLLEEVANLTGEFVGSAHAFFHGEVYRKRSGPAE